MKTTRQLIDDGHFVEAEERLLSLTPGVGDYSALLKLCRLETRLERLGGDAKSARVPIRVGLMGNATTSFLQKPLGLFLRGRGLAPTFYEARFDSVAWECLQPDSELSAFDPDVVVVVTSPLAPFDWPCIDATHEQVGDWVVRQTDSWLASFEALHDRTGCEIVVDNFHALPTRPFGNFATKIPGDRNTVLRRLNLTLAERAPEYVHIHDVDALASRHGHRTWCDLRHWYDAKQPVSFQCLVPYVRDLSTLVASIFVPGVKCIVVDLDNTLWGGVVGDDGAKGVLIGPGTAAGEAFHEFQSYLLRLKTLGIVLAVCSKNEEPNARGPFEELPDMVLRMEDFVAFRANWDPKPDNIVSIANELNIGLDAVAFVDDNPVERDHVRSTLPQVKVIELTDDPADYPALLDDSGWFETVRITNEDRDKTAQYAAQSQRTTLEASVGDYDEYLRSLDQTATIHAIDHASLDRVTQLINKTNQFNLTLMRLSRSQVEEIAADAATLAACVRLSDRFGDNGLISVLHGTVTGERLQIDQWLMSCRVFNRGVERALMNHVVEACKRLGVREIVGRYVPAEKNGLVRDLYSSLGFTPIEPDASDTTGATDEAHWRLGLDDYRPFDVPISISPGDMA